MINEEWIQRIVMKMEAIDEKQVMKENDAEVKEG